LIALALYFSTLSTINSL